MLPGRRPAWAAVLLLAVAATAAPAGAASGVFIDPGGPSGKEYSLQLPAARNGGAGGGGSPAPQGQTSRPAPLFGVGITAPPLVASARHGRAGAHGRRAGGTATSASGGLGRSGSRPPLSQVALARIRHLEAQSGGGLQGGELLLAAAVLAAGGLAGLTLILARRRPAGP